MRLCHFSDWHWGFGKLPETDLYVCTGDMLPNLDYMTHPDVEVPFQTASVKRFVDEVGFRSLLGSPDAPIVCVRGNHDFIELASLFEGCNFVHEFINNESVEVLGKTITGHRGIPYIYGTWNDELHRIDLYDRVRAMPLADIYLTHYPPNGILDCERPPSLGYADRGRSFGLEGMADNLLYRSIRAVHCFGHIHECGGLIEQQGTVRFSNAALTINELEIE